MKSTPHRAAVAALALMAAAAACSHAPPQTSPSPSAQQAAVDTGELAAIAQARADSIRHPYTQADIDFMSHMIGHHAQAIQMASWAPSHGASPAVQTLASRIINAQRDEIATMQRWLRDRQQPVPDPDAMLQQMQGHHMDMPGMNMSGLMPGMLTPRQMAQLDSARGPEFDRLFLTGMIQHHRGALTMVKELFGSYGAGQDELVFKFASDVNVDQTTEIARMQKMLVDVLFQGRAQ